MNQRLTKAQQKLVLDNLPLVDNVIRLQIRRDYYDASYDRDDLYQTGCVGLCQAAARYPGGFPFEPYACKAIYHTLVSFCRKTNQYTIPLPCEDVEELIGRSSDPGENQRIAGIVIDLERFRAAHRGGLANIGLDCLLRQSQGYTRAEIAGSRGVGVDRVDLWLSAARRALRMELDLIS